MPEFSYSELLPTGADETTYRRLSSDGVTNHASFGRKFLEVEPQLLTQLTSAAMHDIAHLLRPAHLRQLRSILDDPEASPNDRYVARDLLKNACIAAGGVLPMCQDTGTAIVMGKRGQHVLTDGRDEEHIARGVYDAYTTLNLRYSQLAPLTMWEERNTGSNLPAQIEIYATGGDEYKFLFMAKGGGSANKSFLYQETKAVLNPARMLSFLEEKIRILGTAACPPYHLAIVVGGTSAEFALKTAKYASAKYLDALPVAGSAAGHGFRDLELEAAVLDITTTLDRIGAAREDCDTIPALLPMPDHAVAGFANSGFRKFLLRRLQLLQARNIRPGFCQPADERRQASTDAVDVEGRYLHGCVRLSVMSA